MNKISKCLMMLVLFLFPILVKSQVKLIPEELRQKLQGKTKLPEIMQEVDAYYTIGNGKNETGSGEQESKTYVHWKRWEWWISSHLDVNGNFVKNINRLNYDALAANEQKWASEFNKVLQLPTRDAGSSAVQREAGVQSVNNIGPDAPFGDWSLVGPTAEGTTVTGDIKGLGRMDRIAFHPTDANTIYVGAPSGNLWKTTNGGTTWASVTDGLPAPGVAGVAVSPTNGNIVYILTGDGDSYTPGYFVFDYGSSRPSIGVFKSTDGGTTWTKMGPLYTGAGDYEGHRLSISPSNGNYLMATTSQGVYRTIDGGVSWTQVKTGEHWDVVFKPGNDSVVYCTSGAAIFYSNNGGRTGTWITATTDFSVASARRIELAVSTNNPNYVYALAGAVPASSTFTGIFRSTNSGVSYTRRTNAPNILNSSITGTGTGEQSDYDLGICVKQNNAEIIATAGLNVWRSNGANGGSVMVNSSIYRENQGPASSYIHPDVHDVQYSPLNNNLYAATDGGFYRSSDDGVTWTNLSAGLATSQFFSMTMRDADADGEGDGLQILAGAQDNGIKHRTTSGGSVFNHVICCDGYGVAIDADNPNRLFYNINTSLYRSTDGGSNSTFTATTSFFAPIAIDYSDPDTVYVGGTSTIRRTFDGFATSTTFSVNTRRVLTTCPSNQTRLYGSSGTNIVRSDDRAVTWVTKSGTPGWPVGTFTINDIDVFPTNSLEVYACFGGFSAGNKVMRSTDGGDNWTNWTGSLPNVPTYSLAVATEGVYIGTEIGVFFRGYSMTNWVPFYNQMPRTPVTELIVNNNGLLYASTFGRGVWLSNRRSACNALLTISGSSSGQYYFEASDAVNATITTPGTEGDSIYVQAGNTITMNPGFEIKAGSFFKGYIAPCSNGGIPTARSESDIQVPHLIEITKNEKLPLVTNRNYYSIVNGRLEFYMAQKGKMEMLAKQSNGTWLPFYPQQIIYPGYYAIPMPNVYVQEVKITLNGKDIEKLK